MQGVAWGHVYNRFGSDTIDPAELDRQVQALMADEHSMFEKQQGICPVCNEHLKYAEMIVWPVRERGLAEPCARISRHDILA